ncbi:transcriptional regulator [Labedella phragmitis]|uniref:Transcriptional regulator n=1 Tax=Labedella phragmitis TaxID=2498849 RepID=A0A444PX11_9MICO|nr:metalloregulator ArsR/SmtB family transcription factor [Labedella phragmitis]RWZ52416.1 transcriptional regulator [Labedella phragmitis]
MTTGADPHQPHYEVMADVFKSLGHPMRIRILEMLTASEEVPVSEFLEELGVEPSHLSHQLSVLRRQRLITAERHGNQVSYRLRATEVADILAVGRTLLGSMATRVGDFLQAATDLPELHRSGERASQPEPSDAALTPDSGAGASVRGSEPVA